MNRIIHTLLIGLMLATPNAFAIDSEQAEQLSQKLILLNEQLPQIVEQGLLIAANEIDEEMLELNEEMLELNEEMAEMSLEMQELAKTLRHLGDEKTANRAFLGILLEEHHKNGEERGVQIIGVTPDGPAKHAGLQANDIILSINGQSMAKDTEHMPSKKLYSAMKNVSPGEQVTLLVERNGKQKELKLVTGSRGDHLQSGLKFLADDLEKRLHKGLHHESYYGPLSGVELYPMNEKLGHYFGTSSGMLVLNVADDKSLLIPGDVLMKIGEREPKSPSQTWRILESYDSGESIKLTLMRRHKEIVQSLTKP